MTINACFARMVAHTEYIYNMSMYLLVNIVNWSRPRLTNCLLLLKKQARHQFHVCTPSSDCLVVYNQFVTLKKCMAATGNNSQGAIQLYPAWNDKVFFTVDIASLAPL